MIFNKKYEKCTNGCLGCPSPKLMEISGYNWTFFQCLHPAAAETVAAAGLDAFKMKTLQAFNFGQPKVHLHRRTNRLISDGK